MLRGATLICPSSRKERPWQVQDLRDNGSTVRAYCDTRDIGSAQQLGSAHPSAEPPIRSYHRLSEGFRARPIFVTVVEVFAKICIYDNTGNYSRQAQKTEKKNIDTKKQYIVREI
ncbi:hypothetical protein BBO01nite_09650 [Brevibacillus borstelensis]|jgi:hypothetical protein|nr:hypothetical protein BBO01nite_09650 [Brevibacillus borstelensis]